MDEKYPIGLFEWQSEITEEVLQQWLAELEEYPDKLAKAVVSLNEEQLDTPYRDGGWTIRQVVHHVADSHMNAYIRTKLTLTEKEPTIKPYEEAQWAELADSALPLSVSLQLLTSLHERWTYLLRSILFTDDRKKEFLHPENGKQSIELLMGTYAWHGRHHLAHIINLCKKMGWD
ncbi:MULTISPECIES: YfiT family bacillithiol transferase [Niallia]|jgi:hypothetical protein|uniref:Putative metal-dependent hydrolase CHH57_01105 n=1 Tax=Niallia circulans TaxID=1397 RepID=A0A268FIE2_NIACI|nr:bacillithiol transferase BstA [Niallia circulans]AYV66351.1 metal-dependent hydrolase [Niallia circulans]AYV70830.1 metal-dependent hydrolase [Niallia circulans]NRG28713.1 bacillithiol transferase BstA [Niallia circulans]PAD85139.1 metal-dependent hydrolase [Niallia circulans]QJX62239.1 bacillithiol transferase BstA [Niallia circulans]